MWEGRGGGDAEKECVCVCVCVCEWSGKEHCTFHFPHSCHSHYIPLSLPVTAGKDRIITKGTVKRFLLCMCLY